MSDQESLLDSLIHSTWSSDQTLSGNCQNIAKNAFLAGVNHQKMDINQTLAERGKVYNKYGSFLQHSEITQALKDEAYKAAEARGNTLDPIHKNALDMIFHKIGRIINGDPNFIDNWHDIAGYAQLVADYLGSEAQAKPDPTNLIFTNND